MENVAPTETGNNSQPAEASANRVSETLPDPFDPERLRLTQDFSSAVGVKKALLSIPVRKPSREWFVKVHPEESYRITTAVIELKEEDRETYLVAPELWPELSTESTFSPRTIFTAMTRQSNLFCVANSPSRIGRPHK